MTKKVITQADHVSICNMLHKFDHKIRNTVIRVLRYGRHFLWLQRFYETLTTTLIPNRKKVKQIPSCHKNKKGNY